MTKSTKRSQVLSIIIPAYNEAKTLPLLLERVFSADTLGLEKEIIVIDDASTDSTQSIIKKYKKKISYTRHKINQGKGAALKTGFLQSTGDYLLIQDADLEYSPADYPLLLAPLVQGEAEVVYGSRFSGSGSHRVLYFWHTVANNFLTLFSNMLTNLNLTDMEVGYKVFDRSVVDAVKHALESKRFGFEPEITARVAKLRVRIFEVGISYHGRTYEEGKKIGWKDALEAVYCIVKYNVFSK